MINLVYVIVRIIQFFIFLATFWLVYHIYKEKNTSKQRVLLLASICAVMNMYGYMEALSTVSEQGSKWTVRMQSASSLLFMALMLHLIIMFCELRFQKWQLYTLWAVNGIFLVLIFIDENLSILFRRYTFVRRTLAIQIRFQMMPMGYAYMAYMALLTVGILYLGTIIRQSQQKDSVITIISIMAALPSVTYVLNVAGVTGGFDFGPSLMAFTCWLTYHFNHNYHLLDDGQIAREVILDELGEGYIILDSERRIKSYNSIAAMLYPELEQPGESEVIVELIYLHNHDVLEHNGKICNIVVSELKESGDLTGYVMWLYDCTDEYYYMKDLEQVQEQASASDKTRDLFLHHMTHGFGSPLHIIKNRSDAIYQDERASEDVREMTLEILEAGQKLEDMVAVMMNYSGDERSLDLHEAEYATDDLVQALYRVIDERRQGRCREIRMTVSPELPTYWYGDRDGIEDVVHGILRCAGIASKISGLEMKITSEMRYADALLIVTLYVEDGGTTTGEINRLAAKVQKGGKNLDTEVNYIPYSLCRRLLMEMKGSIECSVDLDKSKICLMFPQRIIDNTPYGGKAQELLEKKASAGTERKEADALAESRQYTVMVVDDNILYLKEMDSWLRKLQLKTIMAKNGEECLQILKRKNVDMIFMDQMMPGMDGAQTLAEVRKLETQKGIPEVPAVLLAADDMMGVRRHYKEYGFIDYLSKPVEPQKICDQVKQYLNM